MGNGELCLNLSILSMQVAFISVCKEAHASDLGAAISKERTPQGLLGSPWPPQRQ